MNKPKFETPDMVEKNIEKLAEIFPNCITEARDENGKLKKAVNFEMLQQILSTQFPPPRVRRSGTSSPGWGSVRLLLKPINLSVKLCALVKMKVKIGIRLKIYI